MGKKSRERARARQREEEEEEEVTFTVCDDRCCSIAMIVYRLQTVHPGRFDTVALQP